MIDKINKIHDKMKEREAHYIEVLKSVEETLNFKKNRVNRLLHDITWVKENAFLLNKDTKAKMKELEVDILEAEKQLSKNQESLYLNKQYEAQRLQALRDNKKLLDEVIWKDSYQMY